MKRIKRYLKIIFGSLLIGLSLNLFFKNTGIIPSGVLGFSILYNDKIGMDLSLVILLTNIFFFSFGILILEKNKLKKMIIPFLMIPISVFLTKDINSLIDLSGVDTLLVSIYGAVIIGIGHRFIYKENRYASGSDVLLLIAKNISLSKKKWPIYFLDCILMLFLINIYGFENAMYSLVAIIVIETISSRAALGVSDSKVFYIITKKDKEVKNYIMNELHYELTMFDVKGGFLQTKSKVIMSVIPTKDYYKLREGIKEIDPKAFISITDSYEVINQNKTIKDKSK